MMKNFKYLVFVFFLIIVQTQLLRLLSLQGITPDLLTIWIVYLALKYGQMSSTIWGFVAGLIFDLVTGNFIGLSALTKTIAGFTAGYFYEENKATTILGSYRYPIIIFVVSIVHNTIYFIIFTRGSEISLFGSVFQVGLATTFYTTALSLLAMLAFARKHIT